MRTTTWVCRRCGAQVYAIWEPTKLTLEANRWRWKVGPDCDEELIRNIHEEEGEDG